MSVKFEKDTVKTTVGAANQVAGSTVGKVANGYLAVRKASQYSNCASN